MSRNPDEFKGPLYLLIGFVTVAVVGYVAYTLGMVWAGFWMH